MRICLEGRYNKIDLSCGVIMCDKVKYADIYYPYGILHYEGFTKLKSARNEWIPYGHGIKHFENGKKHMEGSFGDDWFIGSDTEYYENGNIKFMGEYNKGP